MPETTAAACEVPLPRWNRVPTLPVELTLRFRLVSATLPDAGDSSDAANDDERLMERLHRALDRLAGEPRRVVLHLPVRMPAGV